MAQCDALAFGVDDFKRKDTNAASYITKRGERCPNEGTHVLNGRNLCWVCFTTQLKGPRAGKVEFWDGEAGSQ